MDSEKLELASGRHPHRSDPRLWLCQWHMDTEYRFSQQEPSVVHVRHSRIRSFVPTGVRSDQHDQCRNEIRRIDRGLAYCRRVAHAVLPGRAWFWRLFGDVVHDEIRAIHQEVDSSRSVGIQSETGRKSTESEYTLLDQNDCLHHSNVDLLLCIPILRTFR